VCDSANPDGNHILPPVLLRVVSALDHGSAVNLGRSRTLTRAASCSKRCASCTLRLLQHCDFAAQNPSRLLDAFAWTCSRRRWLVPVLSLFTPEMKNVSSFRANLNVITIVRTTLVRIPRSLGNPVMPDTLGPPHLARAWRDTSCEGSWNLLPTSHGMGCLASTVSWELLT
jgi:hypothetical protein